MRSRRGPERRPLPDWGFDPAAARDDNDARDYYYDQRPDLADAFEADFVRAVDLIRAHPESSPVMTEEGGCKRLMRRFPYTVYETIEPDQIRIRAVAHEKQRPYYRHDRLTP